MKETKLLSVFAFRKRRRAFALGEALILIIVVMIAFGGIFSSMAMGIRMRERSQVDLDSYLVAQAWFDALESYKTPELIKDQSTLQTAALEASGHLGGSALGGYFRVRVFDLIPQYKGTQNGAHLVELTVRRYTDKDHPLVFLKSLNSSSSNTVQDNAYKRRKK